MKKQDWLPWLWLGLLGLAVLSVPLGMREAAEHIEAGRLLDPPSWQHWLGTDALGRDVLARIACGSAVSVSVGCLAVGIALAVGTLVGLVAGYCEGWVDRALMALVDVMLCFPTFFLILAVIAVLGPGIVHIMIIIGLTSWMGTARLVRAEVLRLKEMEFIAAARVMGAGGAWIMRRHLLPNAVGPVLVSGILGIPAAILVESGLSFLGIGVQPPTPSWGNILGDARSALGVGWWLVLFPGLAIFLTSLSIHGVGESLRRRWLKES